MICAWIVTSSAVVGSSAISIGGSSERPIAIIARWRMPPENSCGYCRTRSSAAGMPTAFSSSTARSFASSLRDVAVRPDLLGDLVADLVDGVQRASSGPGRSSRAARRAPAAARRRWPRSAPGHRAPRCPEIVAFGLRVRPISVIAVTDLPAARLADDRQHLAGLDARTRPRRRRCTTPSSVRKSTRRSSTLSSGAAVLMPRSRSPRAGSVGRAPRRRCRRSC